MDQAPFDFLNDEGITNVALGKPASQSSQSQWSEEGEAVRAVSGRVERAFAFHTEREHNPWWQVDLEQSVPIHKIVIHNRLDAEQERARTLRIELSEDSQSWKLVHAGICVFGSADRGEPLVVRTAGLAVGRYVRVSLDDEEYLHLSQVEVYAKSRTIAFKAYCDRFSLQPLWAGKSLTPYDIEASDRIKNNTIVGLTIKYSGRFGNLLHQYINVIELARTTGLKFIRLGRHELLNVTDSFEFGGIVFIPPDAHLPDDGLFVAGEFFNSDDFVPALSPFLQFRPGDELAATSISQDYIRAYMLTGVPVEGENHPSDEVTVHLRAGDIFGSDHPVTYGYRQPPLSFYVMVVNHLRQTRGIKRARLVYEDRGNPCIEALETWLDGERIPYRTQCGSLATDMSALVDAPHLVFGHGTFGYAACRLSRKIETVHYFAPELGGCYAFIPSISQSYCVYDSEGGYIKAFEYGKPFGADDGWRNTPAMRERMLTYPIGALQLTETSRRKALA